MRHMYYRQMDCLYTCKQGSIVSAQTDTNGRGRTRPLLRPRSASRGGRTGRLGVEPANAPGFGVERAKKEGASPCDEAPVSS